MRPSLGITLMVLAVTVFTVMTSLIKAAETVPAGQAVFFRSFFAVPVILIWLAARGQLADGLRTQSWKGHAVRGVAGTLAMGLGFAGLKYLPLPEVTALRFVSPILIVVLAALMLGERFRLIRLSAVLVGLVGVVVILSPRLSLTGSEAELFGAALVLASAGATAVAQIFVKAMAAREHTAAIVFYFSMTAAALSLLTIPFGWVWPSPMDYALLIGAGLIGGLGQILLTSSYRFADASTLAPFTYVTMIWAIVIGWYFFDEVPTLPMLAGSVLIIGAGAVIVWRERQLGKATVAEGKLGGKGMG